ncbi:MAG: tetratricopeptide repeat-containing protein kinase family protein, partial [Acidobacteriota bacterium]
AHQRGIVHRDLKPSNILVTAQGMPRLLDFGIAIASPVGDSASKNVDASDVAVPTDVAARSPFTPDYASPEQRRGETVTTASDVYSLGVLTHRLITGHLPPSGRTHLPRDLAAIVGQATASTATDRYASARELGDDLRRCRERRPVRAMRGSWLYVPCCWVRRRPALALASLVIVLLVAGALHFAVRGYQAEHQRRQDALVAAFVAELLTTSRLLDQPRGGETIDRVRERIAAHARGRPEIAAALGLAVGELYRQRGAFREAEVLLADAVRSYQELGKPIQLARAEQSLAMVLTDLGELDRAERLYRRALDRLPTHGDDPYLDALQGLASLRMLQGARHEAEILFQRGLVLREERYGRVSLEVAIVLDGLGQLALDGADLDRATAYIHEALDIRRALASPDVVTSIRRLAELFEAAGRLRQAESLYLDAMNLLDASRGPEHPESARARYDLARALYGLGDATACELLLRQALDTYREVLTEDHRWITEADKLLATCWLDLAPISQQPVSCGAETHAISGRARSSLPRCTSGTPPVAHPCAAQISRTSPPRSDEPLASTVGEKWGLGKTPVT